MEMWHEASSSFYCTSSIRVLQVYYSSLLTTPIPFLLVLGLVSFLQLMFLQRKEVWEEADKEI